MTTTIIILIFILIGLLLAVNAIAQYKHQQAIERRHTLLRLAASVSELEELLVNGVQMPMSNQLMAILLQRLVNVFKQVLELMPEDNHGITERLNDAKEQLAGIDVTRNQQPGFIVPKSEAHIAALIKTTKKVRHVLIQEKRRGHVKNEPFFAEDSYLATLLVKTFTEYKLNQGLKALAEEQLGSARQFFEKALKTLKTLKTQDETDEYVRLKRAEIQEYLSQISIELLTIKPSEQEVSAEEGGDHLEMFFSETKRKW